MISQWYLSRQGVLRRVADHGRGSGFGDAIPAGGPSFAGFAKGGDSGFGILSEESQYLQGKRQDRN